MLNSLTSSDVGKALLKAVRPFTVETVVPARTELTGAADSPETDAETGAAVGETETFPLTGCKELTPLCALIGDVTAAGVAVTFVNTGDEAPVETPTEETFRLAVEDTAAVTDEDEDVEEDDVCEATGLDAEGLDDEPLPVTDDTLSFKSDVA